MIDRNMRLIAALVTTLSGMNALGLPAQAQTAAITIATEGAYPPFNVLGPDGRLSGLEVDLIHELCDRMKRECRIIAQEWSGIIPGLTARKYDAIVAGMGISEERKKRIAFSKPYLKDPPRFIARKGTAPLTEPDRLRGQRVGVQKATLDEKYLALNFGRAIEISGYDTLTNAFLDLATGRIDVVLASAGVAFDLLRKPEYQAFTFVSEPVVDDRVYGPGVAVGLRKEDVALKADFDAAIDAVIADGKLDQITSRYLPFTLRP